MRTSADKLISVHPAQPQDFERTQVALRVLAAWIASPYLGFGETVNLSYPFSTLIKDDCAASNTLSLQNVGLRNPELAPSRLSQEIAIHGDRTADRHERSGELTLFDTYLVGPYGVLNETDLEIFEDLLSDESSKYCIHLEASGPLHTSLSGLCAWLIASTLVSPSRAFSRKFPKIVSFANFNPNGTFRFIDVHGLLPTTRGLNLRSEALLNASNVCVAQSFLPMFGLALPELQPYIVPVGNNLDWNISGKSITHLPRVSVSKKDVEEGLYQGTLRIGESLAQAGVLAANTWARFLTAVLSVIYKNDRLVELALLISRKYPRLTGMLRKIVRAGESIQYNPFLRITEIHYLSETFDIQDSVS
jgi:hypothetical protein